MTDPAAASPQDAAQARAFLDRLDAAAQRWETPCGTGTMAWRGWGDGPAAVLLHGGAGSWRHWARNIAALARTHRVIAPDLPGLGDSARAPEPIASETIAGIVSAGLATVLGAESPYHLVGFSFGGVIAGIVAAHAGPRLRSLTLFGTGGLGPPNRSVELVKLRDLTGEARVAAHRENLLRMMLANPAAVDALALEIQEQNTSRARLNSSPMWISPVLHDALPRVQGPVRGIWGAHEMPDTALLEARIGLLRRARPDAVVEAIPDAGHWAFYEAAERCNALLERILAP